MYFDERENEIDYTNYSNEVNSVEKNYTQNDYKKWDNDFKVDIENLNINNFNNREIVNDLYTAKEGLNKGNMFRNLFNPYKSYVYKVVVNGKKDELLLKIQELTFKVVDLNLYLDLNPADKNMYNEFKKAVEELKANKDLYEKNYGPLCVTETQYYDDYMWSKNPWPWMSEGGKK